LLITKKFRVFVEWRPVETQRQNFSSKPTTSRELAVDGFTNVRLYLKQDLKTPIEAKGEGTPVLAQLSAKDGPQTEIVSTHLEETMPLGMSKGLQGLGSGEFPLPTFDENAGVHPVSHLRQLEELFRFIGVQQKHWLTVAKRSITGSMSKQWLEATSAKFMNYEHFKREFLATWRSAAQQGLIKCSLYQSKYDPSAVLSLSAHFL
jgi:hypothetical protein